MSAGTRISTLAAGLFVLLGTLAPLGAQERRLSRKLAQHLVADFEGMPDSFVTIAFILEGSVKTGKVGDHEARSSSRVYYMRQVLEQGRARRRSSSQVFYYDPDLGWFLTITRRRAHADHIEIWSEKRGYICIE